MVTDRLATSTDPRDNARKITALIEADTRDGHADLYRTCVAGPSGQRAAVCVGRVRYLPEGPNEFEIYDRCGGDRAGYATRRQGEWVVWSEDYDGAIHLEGYTSSLSIACDVVVNGVHAATGRHDSRRISAGTFRPYVPS